LFGCTIFFIQNAYNFWSPKQFLLHFYALSFFSDSKFVNFLLFFLIYFLFLANFTLKLVILHTVLEFTAFLSFIAVNGFRFTVYSNKSKNCKNGSHSYFRVWGIIKVVVFSRFYGFTNSRNFWYNQFQEFLVE